MLMPGGRISNDSPDGSIENIVVYGNRASVHGWAYDPNSAASEVKIVVYINGKLNAYQLTTLARPDINASHLITGSHGYLVPIQLSDGANNVCVYAINLGAGANSTLGCHSINLSGAPLGASTTTLRGNVATVSGWTYDYDVPSEALPVAVYVNGTLTRYGPTTSPSPVTDTDYHITGTHGYLFTMQLADGTSTVCTYAINRGTGHNSELACPVVGLSGAPLGVLDSATVSHAGATATATVTGWTYDYDAPTQPIRAVLYLNGKLAGYGPTTAVRNDVSGYFGITGSHGYTFTVPIPAGANQLCMYGISVGTGPNTELGCRSVTG